jgi:outer membrane protein assembly factor BamB
MAARHTSCAVIALCVTASVATAQFEDPKPPKVHKLESIASPKPTDYAALKFFGAPKPLNSKAFITDWPGFLGPRRDSHSQETMLLRKWPKDGPKLVWSMRRGEGYSSPVIVDRRLVFTHRINKKIHIDCLHAETGKRFWRVTYPSDYRGVYITNSGPRSTPTVSEGRVYVHGIQGQLFCLDLDTGRTIWERDLAKELSMVDDFFGVVSSPLIVGDVLVQSISCPKGPTVVGFDKNTGKLLWGTGKKWAASSSSPVFAKIHGRDRVFVLAGGESRPPIGGLIVLDPKTGEPDFEHPFRSRLFASVTGATPVVGDNWVFLTSSYGVGSAVLSLAADGKFKERWKNRHIGLQFSNPVLHDGHIYAIDGVSNRPGAIICLDPATGKELSRTELNWDETVLDGGRIRKISVSIGEGSLLVADGNFLCLGDQGHLLWLDVNPKRTKILARSWLFKANETWTPLALSRGLLYACQNNDAHFGDQPARLLCFDLRRPDQ